jgi:hypothetical protein
MSCSSAHFTPEVFWSCWLGCRVLPARNSLVSSHVGEPCSELHQTSPTNFRLPEARHDTCIDNYLYIYTDNYSYCIWILVHIGDMSGSSCSTFMAADHGPTEIRTNKSFKGLWWAINGEYPWLVQSYFFWITITSWWLFIDIVNVIEIDCFTKKYVIDVTGCYWMFIWFWMDSKVPLVDPPWGSTGTGCKTLGSCCIAPWFNMSETTMPRFLGDLPYFFIFFASRSSFVD